MAAPTVTDVRTALLNKGYPCSLTTERVQGAVDAALLELNAFNKVSSLTPIQSVVDQQDYLIFEPTSPAYIGATVTGVKRVFWNPSGDALSPDIFSPSFVLFNATVQTGVQAFDTPTDMMILRNKLDNWERQFGAQGFEVFGQMGAPTSYLRVYPVPRVVNTTILIEWSGEVLLTNILSLNLGYGRYFMQWVETFIAEGLARKHGMTAGTNINSLKDDGSTMKFWQREGERLRTLALASQNGAYSGIAART